MKEGAPETRFLAPAIPAERKVSLRICSEKRPRFSKFSPAGPKWVSLRGKREGNFCRGRCAPPPPRTRATEVKKSATSPRLPGFAEVQGGPRSRELRLSDPQTALQTSRSPGKGIRMSPRSPRGLHFEAAAAPPESPAGFPFLPLQDLGLRRFSQKKILVFNFFPCGASMVFPAGQA